MFLEQYSIKYFYFGVNKVQEINNGGLKEINQFFTLYFVN